MRYRVTSIGLNLYKFSRIPTHWEIFSICCYCVAPIPAKQYVFILNSLKIYARIFSSLLPLPLLVTNDPDNPDNPERNQIRARIKFIFCEYINILYIFFDCSFLITPPPPLPSPCYKYRVTGIPLPLTYWTIHLKRSPRCCCETK